MAIATVGWIVGATLFIASNAAFEMVSLSHGYAAVTAEAQQATYLAASALPTILELSLLERSASLAAAPRPSASPR